MLDLVKRSVYRNWPWLLIAVFAVGLSSLAWAQEPRRIVIAQTVDLTTLDQTYALDQPTRSVMGTINEPLFKRNSEFTVEPIAVESYRTDDNKTWDFTLRQGLHFNNGEELTAEAVKFTFERIADPNRTPPSIIRIRLIDVDAFEIVDRYTFRVTLKGPNPFFPALLAAVRPVSPMFHETHDADAIAGSTVGTGPFEFVEWVRDSHVLLRANPTYWQGRPALDEVMFRIIPDASSRVASLITGEVDIIGLVPIDDIPRLEAHPDIRVVSVPNEMTMLVGFNQAIDGPLRDVRVRRALNLAVDVEAIVQHVFNGHAEAVPATLATWNFGFNGDLEPYGYDPARARELLTEAGYGDGFDITFAATMGRTSKDAEAAQAIAAYLGEVGVRVKLELMPFQEFIAQKNALQLPEMWKIGWSSGVADAFGNLTWLTRIGVTEWQRQFVDDIEIDRLMNVAASPRDIEEREAVLRQVQQIMHENAYALFLYRLEDVYAVRTRVENWRPPTDEVPIIGHLVDVRD